MASTLDLEKLRLRAVNLPGPATTSRRRAGQFLKGPIPIPWLAAAARLPGRALHVAVGLRFLQGIARGPRVALAPSVLRLFGLQRHAAYRALLQLERAGLARVTRGHGRAPLVTIIECADDGADVAV